MSLYSLTGDFFVPVGLDFNNSSSFTQQDLLDEDEDEDTCFQKRTSGS